jgi:hypothetical protein
VGIRGAGQCATAVKAFDAAEASLVVGNWVHVTILIGPAGRTRVCQTLRTIRVRHGEVPRPAKGGTESPIGSRVRQWKIPP